MDLKDIEFGTWKWAILERNDRIPTIHLKKCCVAEAFLSFEWKDVAHLWGSFLLNNGASNPENKNPDRQKYHLSWPEGFKSYKWFLQKLRCEMSFIQLQKERSKFKEQLGTIDVTAM